MVFHEVANRYTHQSPNRPGSFNRIALSAVFFLAVLISCQQAFAETDGRVGQEAVRAQVDSLFAAATASANINKCKSAGEYVTKIGALLEMAKINISIFKDRHTAIEQRMQNKMTGILGSIQACEARASTAAQAAPPLSPEPTVSTPPPPTGEPKLRTETGTHTGNMGAAGADTAIPILQIETGMHTGQIVATSIDSTDRLLLTASPTDKTARLWSLPDGRPLAVLRPPQNVGLEGRLDAAALSPDGAIAAVGGNTGADFDGSNYIYIFDTRTGQMTARLPIGKNRPSNLVFSPNGRFLVAGLYLAGGIRAWQTDGWTKAGEDTDYGLTVRSISFDQTGRLVTSGDDGGVRLYDSLFRLITRVQVGAKSVFATVESSLSPDGTKVAVTPGLDGKLIDILSGRDLKPMFAPDTRGFRPFEGQRGAPGVDALFSGPLWSSDGQNFYAVASTIATEEHFIATWPSDAQGVRRDQPIRTYMALIPLPGGGFVYYGGGSKYAGDPISWGTIGTKSDISKYASVMDIQGGNIGFRLSADGHIVTFGYRVGDGQRFAEMSLAERELRPISHPTADPHDATTRSDPVSRAASYGLLGNALELSLLDFRTGQVRWRHRDIDSIRDVMLSTDARLAVAASGDGRIRWYRTLDGQNLLTLFLDKDGKHWVRWTSSGYYDASPGGEDLIGWSINRGPDQAADFFPASRFHDRMYRPDVVRLVLDTLDETEALRQANAASGRTEQKVTPTDIVALAPPALDLISAPERFNTDRVTIHFRVHSPADAPMIGDPRIKVNGEWQPTSRAASQISADDSRQVIIGPLPPHDSTVEIYADNSNARSEPLMLALKWDGRAALAPGQQGLATQHKPRLFVLAVGISQYEHPDLRLNFAARDAEQFVAAMQAQRGKLYADVTTKLLRDDEATLAGVKAGLTWFAGQAAADDVGVLFLAGHGVQTPDQNYFYAPADFDPARQRATGVDYRAIRSALDKFSTSGNRVLFFVDTCYPGGALGSNLTASNGASFAAVLSRSDTGIVVLSASKGDQLSYEGPQWQDGAFTKALLEGIVEAKADPAQSGEITVLDLGSYIHRRVLVLTERRQEPTLSMPEGGVADFTVAAH
jgi:WD40 repeat protein